VGKIPAIPFQGNGLFSAEAFSAVAVRVLPKVGRPFVLPASTRTLQ
jgi:hypothetical protein